ncbi:MAG TPA: phytanoyl-CoA dioxygenase family protein, partial [Micropepsaceae bacterium]|nr:phytanoyl-CoA dioxygenase family protein [Micropepsaceae bacterium]
IDGELADIGRLNVKQRMKLNTVQGFCGILKLKNAALFKEKSRYHSKVKKNSTTTMAVDGRNARVLSHEDLVLFERHGVMGPLDLLSPEEAGELDAYIQRTVYSESNPLYGVVKKQDKWEAAELLDQRDIILGVNMFMYDDRVRTVLSNKGMVNILKDLIGTDGINCWRSQLFRQESDGKYTYYHQNVDFADASKHASFVHRDGQPFRPNSALTSWISLGTSTVDTGTMTILAGSFKDTRAYDLQKYFLNNIGDLLNTLSYFPMREIRRMLKIFLFSKGGHRGKSKLLMRLAQFCYEDLFADGYASMDFIARPGQYYAFTSFNVHGSYPSQPGLTRSTLVGRYVDDRTIDLGRNMLMLPGKNGVVKVDPQDHGLLPYIRL